MRTVIQTDAAAADHGLEVVHDAEDDPDHAQGPGLGLDTEGHDHAPEVEGHPLDHAGGGQLWCSFCAFV